MVAVDAEPLSVNAGAHDVGAPVAGSSVTKLLRAVSLVPAAEPAGRTDVNDPPTNTFPCAEATAQAMPLVW